MEKDLYWKMLVWNKQDIGGSVDTRRCQNVLTLFQMSDSVYMIVSFSTNGLSNMFVTLFVIWDIVFYPMKLYKASVQFMFSPKNIEHQEAFCFCRRFLVFFPSPSNASGLTSRYTLPPHQLTVNKWILTRIYHYVIFQKHEASFLVNRESYSQSMYYIDTFIYIVIYIYYI